MRKIIVPTDFSENAYNALRYATQLYKDTEIAFYLLNTFTPTVYQPEYSIHSPSQIGLGDMYQKNSEDQLDALKNKIENEFKNDKHRFISHSAFNILVNEIEEITKKEKVDLIIMGTQGATGAKEIFLGSQTVHVLKKATCPLLMIPSGFSYEVPKEILFPTDYGVDYQKKQLQELLTIAIKHSSNLEVIHAAESYELNDTQKRNKQQLDIILGEIAHVHHDLPDQTVIGAINGFQMKKRMNLLAMIQNKHTFFERLFIEPVIKKISFHVTIPFMVIPHYERPPTQ